MTELEHPTLSAPGDAEPKVIKRYTNRKLYDTVESRYVTLDEIGEMIKQGLEVKIIDNRTKEDLTSVTLAQIIFEEEKKKNRMPLSVLREIIRRAVAANPKAVADFKKGKTKAADAIKGAVMRETKGMAKTEVVQRLLLQELEKS